MSQKHVMCGRSGGFAVHLAPWAAGFRIQGKGTGGCGSTGALGGVRIGRQLAPGGPVLVDHSVDQLPNYCKNVVESGLRVFDKGIRWLTGKTSRKGKTGGSKVVGVCCEPHKTWRDFETCRAGIFARLRAHFLVARVPGGGPSTGARGWGGGALDPEKEKSENRKSENRVKGIHYPPYKHGCRGRFHPFGRPRADSPCAFHGRASHMGAMGAGGVTGCDGQM